MEGADIELPHSPKDQDDETGKASFPGNTSYDTVLSQVQTPTSVVYVTTSNK